MDLHNDIEARPGVVAALNNDTPIVSAIIDMANRQALEFVIATSTIADAASTYTVLIEHADNEAFNDGNEAVADADLLGTEAGASFTQDADNAVRKIGYIGMKRYVRCTVTPADNAGAGTIAIVAILAGARVLPHSSQS